MVDHLFIVLSQKCLRVDMVYYFYKLIYKKKTSYPVQRTHFIDKKKNNTQFIGYLFDNFILIVYVFVDRRDKVINIRMEYLYKI